MPLRNRYRNTISSKKISEKSECEKVVGRESSTDIEQNVNSIFERAQQDQGNSL